jgi:hypothetical protein
MNAQTPEQHKFLHDACMSYQDVFHFAFSNQLIPLMQQFADCLGEEELLATLREAASQAAVQGGRDWAARAPGTDLATFTTWAREPDPFWQHALTFESVEDTERAFEIRVTECLWAQTFRQAGAADIGYVAVCHPDYAFCQAFNPQIEMVRTRTLMQGHECCDRRWIWRA